MSWFLLLFLSGLESLVFVLVGCSFVGVFSLFSFLGVIFSVCLEVWYVSLFFCLCFEFLCPCQSVILRGVILGVAI